MKNLFDAANKQEIVDRINKLTPESQAQWGKMNVSQMFAHNVLPMELALTNPKPPRQLMGRIFGGLVRNKVIGPEPFKKNGFTPKEFKVEDEKKFYEEQKKLLGMVEVFTRENITDTVHPFFGKMTQDEWGELQYKHLDHHLQQFGV